MLAVRVGALLVLLVSVLTGQVVSNQLTEGTFLTSVDHFAPQDNRTALFHYTANLTHFEVGGPLFFYINDAFFSTTRWIEGGLVADVSHLLNGALITTDNRYIGKNLPTPTATLEDLQYLTIEQSLADIVVLINSVKTELNSSNSNVFVWGAGYGAKLATYARQRYPNIITAAWSSSGNFLPEVFNYDFAQKLGEDFLNVGGEQCVSIIRSAFREIDDLVLAQNASTLVREFSLCDPWNVTNSGDVSYFMESLVEFIGVHVNRFHRQGILNLCSAVQANEFNPLQAFARWVRFNQNLDLYECLNYDYAGRVKRVADTEWHMPGTASGVRQFTHYQCTQLGQIRNSGSNSIFGSRVSAQYQYQFCVDILGENYVFENLLTANQQLEVTFGGANPRVSRVIFSNGLLDAWIGAGITEIDNPDSVVFNHPDYAYSADMDSIRTWDSAALAAAKLEITNTIVSWLTHTPRKSF